MGEIERGNRRLPDIGVDMARQAAEPGVHGVDGLGHRREVAALDHLLDEAELLVGGARIGVPHRHRRGDIGDAGIVGAEFLKREIGVGRLVRGVRIDQRRGFVGHHLLQDRGDRLALGEPLAADLGQQLGRVGLVEQDGAGGPAIGKGEPVQLVEQAGRRRRRKSGDRQHAQMLRAEARLQAAGERLIGQQRVEIHRRLGNADAVPLGRDAGVQIGQRLAVIEPDAFRHEGFDEAQNAVGAIGKAGQHLARIEALLVAPFVEPAFRARGVLGRRQIGEGEEVAGLEMRAGFLEIGLAFGIDQRRGRVRETCCRDSGSRHGAAPRRRSPSPSRGGGRRC